MLLRSSAIPALVVSGCAGDVTGSDGDDGGPDASVIDGGADELDAADHATRSG